MPSRSTLFPDTPIMNVLLISANTERINMPTMPLGLAMVAAAVRQAGYETAVLDLLSEADPAAAIRRAVAAFAPQVIGVSVRNVDDQVMEDTKFLLEPVRELVTACRATTAAPIVLGGAGYSIFPDAALAYLGADFGIRGEGEVALPALLARLQRGEDPSTVPGVHVSGRVVPTPRTFAQDLDALPLPGEDLWSSADPQDPEVWVPVQTRRGCPLACTYCSTPALEGRDVRVRSPQLVTEHIARVAKAGFRRFYFVDNTFNLPPAYALEICRRLEALHLDLAWRGILYPHQVPEGLVAAMARAGCVEVSLGFESGSRRVLRAMNKRFDPEEVQEISERLATHGIRRRGFLLLGGPKETEASVEESLDFADSLHLEALNISVGIRIYPHTVLAELARKEGIIDAEGTLLHPQFYLRPGLENFIRAALARR